MALGDDWIRDIGAVFDQLWRVVLLAVIIIGLLLGFLAGAYYVLGRPSQGLQSEYVQFVTHCEGCGSEFWKRIHRSDIQKQPKTFKSCPNCPLTQEEFEELKKQALEKEFDPDSRAFQHQLRPALKN